MAFTPDYRNVENAARNVRPQRIPLYEHIISDEMIGRVLGQELSQNRAEYMKQYAGFFHCMGYDTVSFEQCITKILPGGGALYAHADPVIKTKQDFDNYPFDTLKDVYFKAFHEDFKLLRDAMPDGMKAIGGPGNGLFEIVQDLCGYENLCYLSIDDRDFYAAIFERVAEVMLSIWKAFLEEFSDVYCVCRFGDDLGFRSQTLLAAPDIREIIIPQYQRLVAQVHRFEKPFLLHSCGCIFDVMDDIIREAKIDAKHSNEDAIAPFSDWISRYGDRIGNFGGFDTDALCSLSAPEVERYVAEIFEACSGKQGGIAFGSGNSIPEYVPKDGYLAMIGTVRELRGE